MENKSDYSVVITTCENHDKAKHIAGMLLGARLAACAQVFPIESMYVWQDKICEDNEAMLLIKSKSSLFDKISEAIRECHSYETPEIIQIPVTAGFSDYLAWIDASTESPGNLT